MTRNWLITKNVLAVVLMLFALLVLYSVLPVFSHTLRMLLFPIDSWDDVKEKLPFFLLIKLHFGIFNSVVMFWGAFWLLRGKSEGWLLSVIIAILNIVLYAQPSETVERFSNIYWVLMLGVFVQLIIPVLLLMKPIRSAYRPDRAAWLVSIILASTHIILRIIFR